MKGILFFVGSIFRWPVQNKNEFFILHVYLLGLYGITFLLKNVGLSFSNLIFTVGFISPIGYLIEMSSQKKPLLNGGKKFFLKSTKTMINIIKLDIFIKIDVEL